MKKLYLTVFTSLFLVIVLMGQHFVFEPTDHYEDQIPLNSYTEHRVFMKNLTGEPLTLSWERIYLDFPVEWTVTTCDNSGCYNAIPPSGTMMAVQDTTRGFLELTVNANSYEATGVVVFKVYNYKHPEQSDTLTYTIHAGEVTATSGFSSNPEFMIYPNPTSNFISLKSNSEFKGKLTVIDIHGKIHIEQNFAGTDKVTLDTGHLSKGIYFVTMADKSGRLNRTKMIID